MSVQVYIHRKGNFYSVRTCDDFDDELAGPFGQYSEAKAAIGKLGVDLVLTTAGLNIGDLFRVGEHWYRLLKWEKGYPVVAVIGTGGTITLKERRISEISVLSKQ